MKVTLIGTGCIYTKENSACTLINDDLIVDMPNGALKELLKKGYDVTKIKTVVITHLHGDHTSDVPFFLKLIFNSIQMKDKITVVGPVGTRKKLIELSNAYNFENEERFNSRFNLEFKEILNDEIEVNNYKIKSYEVLHGTEKPCLAYLVNDKLGITGDSSLCDSIEKLFSEADVIISDTSVIEGDLNHLGIDNIKYLIDKYGVKVIPTHMRKATREKLIEENIENFKVVNDFYEMNI